MTTPSTSPLIPDLRPPTVVKSHYSSAYILIENFVFNPTSVTGFLHRPATNEESVPVTEVLYGSHHVSVEDRHQHLFHALCNQTNPRRDSSTI